MFEPKIKNKQTELLMKAVLTLSSEEDAYRFFEDLCTIPEIKSISQRLEVAWLLFKKETYQRIEDETGASSATISRVNRALIYGADGYRRVLEAMGEDE
ncbi:MAG: TrpR-like protein YerC/YecD [Clostridia bacterium]|jgi:TrpR-related protein YerC/YecD|nr:TrpR-like protein YerC/YecD [Clostridia bacterium]